MLQWQKVHQTVELMIVSWGKFRELLEMEPIEYHSQFLPKRFQHTTGRWWDWIIFEDQDANTVLFIKSGGRGSSSDGDTKVYRQRRCSYRRCRRRPGLSNTSRWMGSICGDHLTSHTQRWQSYVWWKCCKLYQGRYCSGYIQQTHRFGWTNCTTFCPGITTRVAH